MFRRISLTSILFTKRKKKCFINFWWFAGKSVDKMSENKRRAKVSLNIIAFFFGISFQIGCSSKLMLIREILEYDQKKKVI